jgi:holo-[acyl-carrier protein] synthase
LSTLRLGADIVEISRIEQSLDRFGERFLRRLFTQAEIDYATQVRELTAQRLAARFAAKEAALKAFNLCEAGIDWRQIEVRREGDGACRLVLHGKAAALAGEQAGQACVSLSHDGDYAIGVVAVVPVN